ncbi:DUF559 domain-containing protein [Caulobacter sp. SLTY]|nr:DUF559 domain-containing protein [Caulobacter sp. SLTY]
MRRTCGTRRGTRWRCSRRGKAVEARRAKVIRAQILRSNTSLPEGLLWQHLRGRQLEGLKFRRQHPMGPYVLDFFCPALGLAVEIDSQWHYGPGREEHDAIRDTWLKRRGVTVLRLPAQLVLSDMSSTIDTILGSIADRAGKP